MDCRKLYDSILEDWLPTPRSILTAGSTISLTLLSIGLPEYLQKIGIKFTVEKTLLLRTVAPLMILCAGTFIVLLLVVLHYKSVKSSVPGSIKYARQQVERWRKEIQSFSHQGGSFNTHNFMQSTTYAEMFPFLSSKTMKDLNSNNITVICGGRQSMVDTNILMALYTELDRISAK